jgi:Mrr N-terminal domain
VALPTYKDVDLALLLELVRAGRAMRPAETYQPVARHFPDLTEADLAITRADGRTKVFQNVVHWVRDRHRVRGLLALDQPGLWRANENAREALVEDLVSRGASRSAVTGFIDESRLIPDLLGPHWSTPGNARWNP